MKNPIIIVGCCLLSPLAYATDLLDVYEQAYQTNPTFQQAIAQHRADQENIAIAKSAFFPTFTAASTGTLSKTDNSGNGAAHPGDANVRAYNLGLTLSQTLFKKANYDSYGQAKFKARAGDATFNAAVQTLMQTITTDYFTILKAEEDVRYALARQTVFQRQLQQTEQQYKVGLKTLTDVALAKSNYETSVADYVSSVNDLETARENLRADTGVEYNAINQLKEDFPLIKPDPLDPKKWVDVAIKNNWQLQADRLTAEAAKKQIAISEDAALPTVSLNAEYNTANTFTSGAPPSTTLHAKGPELVLTVNYPIFQGGLVNATTRQNVDLYEVADQAAQATYQQTVSQTRQDYLKILATIKKIEADKQAIISGESALEGAFAGYKVGTKTLVDILTAQETLYQAQSNYANDRLTYITTSISLKNDTGTLSTEDLKAINAWLVSPQPAGNPAAEVFDKIVNSPENKT